VNSNNKKNKKIAKSYVRKNLFMLLKAPTKFISKIYIRFFTAEIESFSPQFLRRKNKWKKETHKSTKIKKTLRSQNKK